MIHTDTKDVITRTEALMIAFGWQGSTIHQLAKVTGCDAHELIYTKANEHEKDYTMGWFAYQTNSLEFNVNNIQEKTKGNLQFWLGVAGGVQTSIKLKEDTPQKFRGE